MNNPDPNVWKALPHGGLVKREYLVTRKVTGQPCRIPVTLGERNEACPDFYHAQPLAGMHCLDCPDWVNVKTVTPL